MFRSKTTIDMEKTGRNLQGYVDKFGYSVKDIQQYLGLSCPQSIYRWFKGGVLPSVDNLLRLSELFNVHMEELIVKRTSRNYYVDYSVSETDSILFIQRIQAYCFRFQYNEAIGLSVQ